MLKSKLEEDKVLWLLAARIHVLQVVTNHMEHLVLITYLLVELNICMSTPYNDRQTKIALVGSSLTTALCSAVYM